MAVIAIDFDNTLVNGSEWLPGAKDALRLLREKGHKVVINSCNNPKWIEKQLAEAGLTVDLIWDHKGKALADLYIDDRGFDFRGDWASTISEVLEHRHVKDKDNRKW